MNLQRPYKEVIPKRTISKIQSILNEIDLMVLPISWGNPYNEIYSVRVEAIDEDGKFASNGKGRTQLFALASAYAELIERIQNQLIAGVSGFGRILLDSLSKQTGFYYYPDEKRISKNEFLELPKELLEDICSTKSSSTAQTFIDYIYSRPQIIENNGIIAVPFYDVSKKCISYLPYNLLITLTGSNGMAAGNTLAEATFQSLCEIYERNAASIIYYNRLTPPTIEKSYLKQFSREYDIISKIEKSGFKVIVKDFSCNLSLPVVGLIIIDEESNMYRLNVGSDTSFQVALSRTLTEIYQGSRSKADIRKYLLEMPNEKNAPYFYDLIDEAGEQANLKSFMKNGLGFFPPSLFASTPSYDFIPETFSPKESYEEEVRYLLELAENLNYKVYIRDVSFLGFPSVYIFIPSVSLLGQKTNYSNSDIPLDLRHFDEVEAILFPFNTFLQDEKKITKLLQYLKEFTKSSEKVYVKDLFRLTFKNNSVWDRLPLNFFQSMLHYLIGNYDESINELKDFISENRLQENDYYQQIICYLECIRDGKSINHVNEEIVKTFKEANSLFQGIGIPNCPNCLNCSIKDDCLTRLNLEKTLKINNRFKQSTINQKKFRIYNLK